MTNKEASIILKNTASTLKDGIKYLKESHQKQFKEAYEMAIKDLEQTQWIPIKFRPITEEEKQWQIEHKDIILDQLKSITIYVKKRSLITTSTPSY